MEAAIINAALWVVGKALDPVKDGLLEAWAATTGLAPNVRELKLELLYAQAMLDNARDREPRSSALVTLLRELRRLAYNADDVLDELDYFRIQDTLDGTYHAADVHPRGCIQDLVRDACYTAKAVGKRLSCCSFPCARNHIDHSHAAPSMERVPPKLKFDRVEISKRMKDIIDKLKPLCVRVSPMLTIELQASNSATIQHNAMDRPKTTPYIIEPILFGRDIQKKSTVECIVNGEYSENKLTVLPIVGPGGIGKTTFTQHIYQELKIHFDILVWICVSQTFSAARLTQEAVTKIPKSEEEKENGSDQELIEQRIKAKRFLLVLDDMWTYHEDEWKKLLAPFRKGEEKGNMVIVTTRSLEVANMVKTIDYPIEMGRLEAADFMKLFEVCVFGDQQQPWENHPELFDAGNKIVTNLKGNPLAAKTVGRLLRNQLTLDYWTIILESKEWELQTNDNDIMPALKLSYDYLPFILKQCFSYCALFPEDHEFGSSELIHLWIGLGILQPSDHKKRIEDIGLSYLNDLVNHGFLKKNEKDDGCPYYIVHDLLHELAVKVSSYECLSIRSSNVRSIQISPNVRHLSIIVDDIAIGDRMTFEDFKRDTAALGKRLKVENIHTLVLFGTYHGSFTKTFGDLLREARALRTIYLSGVSYNVDKDMLHNFSKLVHLRYLRMMSAWDDSSLCLPAALVRLYHLEVLDLQGWRGSFDLKGHISNLVKLRHFLLPFGERHTGIFEVGKLEFLQELRKFNVGNEKGFELSQLGKLTELGGSLEISDLEKVQTKEEAVGAKLMHKSRLHELKLEWNTNWRKRDLIHEQDVLESLRPHSNLRHLCISGHGGISCPTWLGANLCVKNLESLKLDNVPWKELPPLGELFLVDESGIEHMGCIQSQMFHKLKRLELTEVRTLRKWVVSCPHSASYPASKVESSCVRNVPCNLFLHLEVLIIQYCPELSVVPLFPSTCCLQEASTVAWFPRLRELTIRGCPNLLSLPPIPWTRGPCCVTLEGVGSGNLVRLGRLLYKNDGSDVSLAIIKGRGASDRAFWKVLDFNNLKGLRKMQVTYCPPLPLDHLRMLSSLKELSIWSGYNLFPVGESHVGYQFPVEVFWVGFHRCSGKELTRLLSCFPKLTKLDMFICGKLTGLGVLEQNAAAVSTSPSLDDKMDLAGNEQLQREVELELSTTKEEGLVLLPPQLQELGIYECRLLRLHPNTVEEAGGWLQGLRSLRSLVIDIPGKFLSHYSSSSSPGGFPFPASLRSLNLNVETSVPLSNLNSLENLSVHGYSRGPRAKNISLWPLLAQGSLTKLSLSGRAMFLLSPDPDEASWSHGQGLSPKLGEFKTNDLKGILATPICSLLSSSLTKLVFSLDNEVESFTKEQEKAIQLLTSLQHLGFQSCHDLQCLPAGLRALPNLKILKIFDCKSIQSLPQDGLPSSLQELHICNCPAIRSLPKEALPISLQQLTINFCPDIFQSLHEDIIPSSLRVLDVRHNRWGADRMQLRRRLTGTVPILRI